VLSNLVNAGLDGAARLGHWGFPAMGAPGSALATTITRFAGLLALLAIARRDLEPMLRPWRREALATGPLLRTFQLGLPIGAQNSVEFTTFAAISVFAGWFGAEAVSGHQVAINLASLMFMVPLGIGSASSVLVGHAIGEQDMAHARRVAASALAVGAGYMALSACVLLAIPGPVRERLHLGARRGRGGVAAHPHRRRVPGVRRAPGRLGRRLARRRRHARTARLQRARLLARGHAREPVARLPRRHGRGRAVVGFRGRPGRGGRVPRAARPHAALERGRPHLGGGRAG
jgi:hypothetical protein